MNAYRMAFEQDMATLKDHVSTMIDLVRQQYLDLLNVLEAESFDDLTRLIEKDERVNDLEDDINDLAFLIILKECPVARDLRSVLTAIRMANDLERLGDYVVNIVKYVMNTKSSLIYKAYITEYFKPINQMFNRVKQAYQSLSIDMAYEAVAFDQDIDQIYEKHVKRFIRILKQEVNVSAEESGRILFVIKQLERAGDHLTNIAEAIIYLIRAQRVTLN